MNKNEQPFFVFDVESVGLHGEGFAVAGGIFIDGSARSEFKFCCPPEAAEGANEDLTWVRDNVPPMEITHNTPHQVREAFWFEWRKAERKYKEITMAAECPWPVEANFVSACIKQGGGRRTWHGPYPFYDISSFMAAAGMDPMATYDRSPSEMPAHDPLADARQSARLLAQALTTTPTKDNKDSRA